MWAEDSVWRSQLAPGTVLRSARDASLRPPFASPPAPASACLCRAPRSPLAAAQAWPARRRRTLPQRTLSIPLPAPRARAQLPASLVVVGVGVKPEVELFKEQLPMAESGGIRVDDRLRPCALPPASLLAGRRIM